MLEGEIRKILSPIVSRQKAELKALENINFELENRLVMEISSTSLDQMGLLSLEHSLENFESMFEG